MKNKQGDIMPIALMAFAVVAFLVLVDFSIHKPAKKSANQNVNIAATCQTGAKLCSDGIYVGRTGLNCEFAACPTTNGNSNSPLASTDDTVAGSALVEQELVKPKNDVVELTENFSWKGYAGIAASVMKNQSLIGSHGGNLYEYDGTTVNDISEKVQISSSDGSKPPVAIISLADNEEYWLILTKESTTQNHLYKYDGKTWTDLTESYHVAQGGIDFPFGDRVKWEHDRWFFFEISGKILTYQNNEFTDITPFFPVQINRYFMNAVWDGSAFQVVASTNYFQTAQNEVILFSFNETSAREIGRFDVVRSPRVASWNGEYWLMADESGAPYLRYDGKKAIITDVPAEPGFYPLWLDAHWIVGGNYYDGQQLAPAPWFGLLRAYTVDIGQTYGIITSYNDRVIRFNFR